MVFPAEFDFAESCVGLVARDSKLLSERQRGALYDAIVAHSVRIETCAFSARQIDSRGINWANTRGFARLIGRIDADRYIVDGRWRIPSVPGKDARVSCLVRADQTVAATLAAGVVAKVRRDAMMRALHARFPAYGWDRNTGHGTAAHISAIRDLGPTRHHRTAFVATALRARGRGRIEPARGGERAAPRPAAGK